MIINNVLDDMGIIIRCTIGRDMASRRGGKKTLKFFSRQKGKGTYRSGEGGGGPAMRPRI